MNRLVIAVTLAAALSFSSPALAIIISASQGTATQGMSDGNTWNGVGSIIRRDLDNDGNLFETVDDQWCTGTMLNSDLGLKFILTAAHCLYYPGTNNQIPNNLLNFNLPEGGIANTFYGIKNATPHPLHVPGSERTVGNDIAILELFVDLTGSTVGWEPNRGEVPDERAGGLIGHKVGFGLGGDGVNGATANPVNTPNAGDPNAREGVRRSGTNRVELFGPVVAANAVNDLTPAPNGANLLTMPPNSFAFDFDDHVAGGNGSLDPAVNGALSGALAAQFSAANPTTGSSEVDTAPGDSGGPMFIFGDGQWRIVGVTSYGTDSTAPGSRFNDIAVDTRVQAFQPFIDNIIPEPSTYALAVLAFWGVLVVARRRRK